MKLKDAIGKYVRLVTLNDCEPDEIDFTIHGTLDHDDEDHGGRYHVLVNDDPQGHGFNSVGFYESNVIEVYRQSSGIIEITLRV